MKLINRLMLDWLEQMAVKFAYYALNYAAMIALSLAMLIIAAPFVATSKLASFYRRLELRYVYKDDEAKQDRDRFYGR
ncbi:hypothetical protein RFN29_30620 [Mesorhizobium sp. VK22B]|uniref:Uncharacterized protein n=1 Tax=Mesorhizobium captivum TaxID=3072319 RepID=A0ABU4Z9J9_9HYPH|nr:hypothetical protein [Mesorhizobium sp. VK22B]MDX8495901.1 hypothetical protein [Mesorhizobium sp. VK22B]